MDDTKYDPQKRSHADKAAVLRAVVAVYIGYLGYKIACAENTTMSVTTARIIGGAFIAAAAAFGVYIAKRWISDRKEAVYGSSGDEDGEDSI